MPNLWQSSAKINSPRICFFGTENEFFPTEKMLQMMVRAHKNPFNPTMSLSAGLTTPKHLGNSMSMGRESGFKLGNSTATGKRYPGHC